MHPSTRYAVRLTVRLIGLTVVLLVVAAVGARFVPAMGEDSAAPELPLGLVLGLFFVQVAALAYPVIRSRWSGWRLVATTFVIFFGPVTFMGQIESLVYLGDKMSAEMLRGIFLMGLFNAAVFAPIAVGVLRPLRTGDAGAGPNGIPPLPARALAVRTVALAALYVMLYYLFGYYVAWQDPGLRAYYGGTDPGSFAAQMASVVSGTPWMVPLQFVRALLWVAIALPVVRMMRGPWWEAGLALSLLFAVPSLYLLLPNPVMPENVARIHLIETLPYQFLFGWVAAWVLRRHGG